jgi:hypothetical protein
MSIARIEGFRRPWKVLKGLRRKVAKIAYLSEN